MDIPLSALCMHVMQWLQRPGLVVSLDPVTAAVYKMSGPLITL